jgi:MFS family permease
MNTVLKREQKETIGLLQIGTFLEYFDLMLYVHMAVLLNELFFPKTDPHTAALLSAFAFCSTYVLRPFGALIFGYIGDHIGRKSTVILTTMMMSISCIIMANLPTYAQVGITAAWLVTLCRVLQGISSMSEIIGAHIYVTELIKPPSQYVAMAFISVASALGSVCALGISALVTHSGFNWRLAFWIGAAIAVVGSMARTKLRETPEFVDAKRRRFIELDQTALDESTIQSKKRIMEKEIQKEKVNYKTSIAYFLVYCGWPLSFYLSFMYFNPILKGTYGYSAEDVIYHNFLLSLISLAVTILLALLSYKINPLKILTCRGILLGLFTCLLPWLIHSSHSYHQVFLIQTVLLLTALAPMPADSIFLKHFPIFKRFTMTSLLYALKSTIMYVITSFSLVYLNDYFGHWGLWFIMFPVIGGFLWGIKHFEKLEENTLEGQLSVIVLPSLVKSGG